MIRIGLITLTTAAILGGVAVCLFALPNVDAHPAGPSFSIVCADQAWPHYVSACVRDHRQAGGYGRDVRVVLIDRLPMAPEKAFEK